MNSSDAVVAGSAQPTSPSSQLFVVAHEPNSSACYQRCSADVLYSTQEKFAAYYIVLGTMQLSLGVLIFVICNQLYRGTFCGLSATRSCLAKRLYIMRWLVLCHLIIEACSIWRVSHGQGSFACSSFQGNAVLGLTYDPRGINPECFANFALTSFANSAAALWWLLLGVVNFTACTCCVQEGQSTCISDVGSAESQPTSVAATGMPRRSGIYLGILYSDVIGWTGYVWLLAAAVTAPLLFVRAAVGGDELTGSCTFQPSNGSILGLTDSAYHAIVLLALCVCVAPLGAARLECALQLLTCNLGRRARRFQKTSTDVRTNAAFQNDHHVEATDTRDGGGAINYGYSTVSEAPERLLIRSNMNQSQSTANCSTQQSLCRELQEGTRFAAASVEQRKQQLLQLEDNQRRRQQQPVASVNGAPDGRGGSGDSGIANRSVTELGCTQLSSIDDCGDTTALNITVSSLSSANAAVQLRTQRAPSELALSCSTPGGNREKTPQENLPADQAKSELKRPAPTCTKIRTIFAMCILVHIVLSVLLVSANSYLHIIGAKTAKAPLTTANTSCFELSRQAKLELPSKVVSYGKIVLEQVQAIAVLPFLLL